MKDGKMPDPETVHPIFGYDKEIYVKPTVTNPNIVVGDFTYIADTDFESHVTHHYPFIGDKLIIGKFCANAFIPFLIPEYASITVLDPRYYYDDIDALMGSNFTDVLFLYNVNTFSEDTNLKMVLRNNQ